MKIKAKKIVKRWFGLAEGYELKLQLLGPEFAYPRDFRLKKGETQGMDINLEYKDEQGPQKINMSLVITIMDLTKDWALVLIKFDEQTLVKKVKPYEYINYKLGLKWRLQ